MSVNSNDQQADRLLIAISILFAGILVRYAYLNDNNTCLLLVFLMPLLAIYKVFPKSKGYE